MVVIFGIGESFRSIWTHNRQWLTWIGVVHAGHTPKGLPLDPAGGYSQEKNKGLCAASSGDRKRPRGRVLTARMCRGGSCAKVGEVGGPIYAEIQYI